MLQINNKVPLLLLIASLNAHSFPLLAEEESKRSLKVGDKVLLNNNREAKNWGEKDNFGKGYILGMLIGDGVFKENSAILSVFNEENDLGTKGIKTDIMKFIKKSGLKYRSDFDGWFKISGRNESRLVLKSIYHLAKQYGFKKRDKNIKPCFEKVDMYFHRGFISGYFDADGSVQGGSKNGYSVRLSQSNLHNLKCVQRLM